MRIIVPSGRTYAGGFMPAGGPAAAGGGPAADFTEDFSTYTSTANLLSNPKGWYAGFGGFRDDTGGPGINLDSSVFYPGYTKSMRFDYPDRTSDVANRCSDFDIYAWIDLTAVLGAAQEVWYEATWKSTTNFCTASPPAWSCSSGQGLKWLDMAVDPGDRFSLGLQTDYFTTPGTPTGLIWPGYPLNISPVPDRQPLTTYNVCDGNWHVIRIYNKISTGYPGVANSDGRIKFWLDGALLVDHGSIATGSNNPTNFPNTPPTRFTNIALNQNLNQGPDRTQSEWWGSVKVWKTNPGW